MTKYCVSKYFLFLIRIIHKVFQYFDAVCLSYRINAIDKDGTFPNNQVYYYIVDSIRNEGKDAFEINSQSGEVFTKQVFDREQKGAFALEVEARDGAPSARPNSGGRPNTGRRFYFI